MQLKQLLSQPQLNYFGSILYDPSIIKKRNAANDKLISDIDEILGVSKNNDSDGDNPKKSNFSVQVDSKLKQYLSAWLDLKEALQEAADNLSEAREKLRLAKKPSYLISLYTSAKRKLSSMQPDDKDYDKIKNVVSDCTSILNAVGVDLCVEEVLWKIRDKQKDFIAMIVQASEFKNKKRLESDLKALDEAIKAVNAKKKASFDLLTLLGMMRQSLAHETNVLYLVNNEKLAKEVDNRTKKAQIVEARNTLRNIYAEGINQFNKNFIANAAMDLQMICSLYNAVFPDEKEEIVRAYYKFVHSHDYVNMGFSFTRIRENMVVYTDASNLLNEQFDSVRGRLYRTFDFVLYRHYTDNEEEAKALVEKLRATLSTEEKEAIYADEAKRVWPIIRGKIMDEVLPWVSIDIECLNSWGELKPQRLIK